MPKLAFLFPGQGAQNVGMAQQLCDTLPAAKELFDDAAAILGYDLLEVCADGPKDRLDSTAVSQPAIYVASLAALEQLKATEPDAPGECVAAAGLSLGEYTALTFAGALTFEDGLTLVKQRGEAMQAAADEVKATFARQVVEPVRWEDSMRAILDSGVERFYEIGPGRVLAGLLKRISRKTECRNVMA